jgi:hypothetical protein
MNAMRRAYLGRSSTQVPAYSAPPGHASTIETGKPLLRFVTPSDVRDLKNRIDPFVRALDTSAAACAGLPASVADGWGAFSKAWRSYFDEEDSWWHTAAQMDQGEAYESDVQGWQALIATYKCTPDAPTITPTDDAAAGADRWSGTVKTVAIAGAVIAVALGLRAVLR